MVPIPRAPVLVKVEVPVAPKEACDDERTLEKKVDEVPFVIVSPPLKFKSVVVALPMKGYAKMEAEVR